MRNARVRGLIASLAVCIPSVLAFGVGQTSQNDAAASKQALAEIQKRIAGREDELAERVFSSIQTLKGKKASRLPGMMSALTGLLGVECSHCHVPGKWESEEKAAKQTTRKHFEMQAELNQRYFGGANSITCWTCHRGKPKPE